MKTNQNTLIKMLSIINSVLVYEWNIVRKIVEEYSSVKEIKKECVDWMYEHKFDLSKINTWSTYNNSSCISLIFYIENKKLYCNTTIWNGDNFYGNRKSRRFTAKLQLPINFINNISSDIEYGFNRYTSNMYEEHLALQRELWISNAKKELLN